MGDLGLEMQGNDNVSPPSAGDFMVHQEEPQSVLIIV